MAGFRLGLLVVVAAGLAACNSDVENRSAPATSTPTAASIARANQVPSTSAAPSTQPVPCAPPSDDGPVQIQVSPATVLAGRTVRVSYRTDTDQTIGRRWTRPRQVEWRQCDRSGCRLVAWLRYGTTPVTVPGSSSDARSYQPDLTDQPDGPDPFLIPNSASGTYTVCPTFTATTGHAETTPCTPVRVEGVPPAGAPGDASGWFEIDPKTPPTPGDTDLHFLVHADHCNSPPVIARDPEVITASDEIAIRVPIKMIGCTSATNDRPTPATIHLPAPLDDKAILHVRCLDPLTRPISDCPTDDSARRWPDP